MNYSNIDFKADATVVTNKIKEYLNSDKCTFWDSKFKTSERVDKEYNQFNTISEIIKIMLCVVLSIILYKLTSTEYIEKENLQIVYAFVAFFEGCVIYIIISMLDIPISEKYLDRCFNCVKKEMKKDIEILNLLDFIEKWYGLEDITYWRSTDKNTVYSAIQSYIVQERIKEINNKYTIVKIKPSGKQFLKVYYATDDGTVKDEEFRINNTVQNINAKEPSIKIDDKAITLITPASI